MPLHEAFRKPWRLWRSSMRARRLALKSFVGEVLAGEAAQVILPMY